MVLHLHSVGLLIIVFLAVVQSQPQVVYISPDPETMIPCPKPCMTLSQYASSDKISPNTILRFLPGSHRLTRVLSITNLSSFKILRASSTSPAVIKIFCLHQGYFELSSTWSVHMSDLWLEGCYGNTIASVTKFELKNVFISGGPNITITFDPERAFSVVNSNMTISDCSFTNNKGGALLVNGTSIVTINRCNFDNNYAHYKDGVTNDTVFGGAVFVHTNSIVFITNSTFNNNSANRGGGVYAWSNSTVFITNCIFNNNTANRGGGICAWTNNNVSITNCTFRNNTAKNWGGGVYIQTNNTVPITSSVFESNKVAIQHGAGIYVETNNNVSIDNSSFNTNHARKNGAGVMVWANNTVTINKSTFDHNKAGLFGGGVLVGTKNTISIINSTFYNNSANKSGGGIFVDTNDTVSITNCTFNKNSATATVHGAGGGGGGGIFVKANNILFIANCTFNNNSANNYAYGGGVYISQFNTVEFTGNTNMRTNSGNHSILYIVLSLVSFSGHTIIKNNNGSVFALSSNISFRGKTIIDQNIQSRNSISQGGLITALRSKVSLTGSVEILYNTADNGGAISAIQSSVHIKGSTSIEHNHARISGGGIYAYLSQVDFSAINCTIKGNTAVKDGGGIHAVGSTVSLSKGSLLITKNKADLGGGMCLEMNAKLMIFTEDYHTRNSLLFTHNAAQYKGGAIYVADNTSAGTCSSGDNSIRECFFQALALYTYYVEAGNSYKDTFFFNNTAIKLGDNLYGGLLDRCKVSPFVEGYIKKNYTHAVGRDYFKDVTNLIMEDDTISSDSVRVCICINDKPNCTIQSLNIRVQKGRTINLRVVAVDQVEQPVSKYTYIHASLSKHQHGSYLKVHTNQREQNSSCTELKCNIVSLQSSEELVLYADGPCKYEFGLSRLVIPIDFLECTCPAGFIASQSNDSCSCGCNLKLFEPQNYVEKCFSDNTTLLRSGTSWISYIHNCTDSLNFGYIVNLYCPYDYCLPTDQHVYINVSIPNGSDAQCAFNRSGKLCGSCESGLSHSLGSSRCMSCTNTWLALLLVFSLAGIVLVLLILMLKLTVASGTIKGIMFYANIIAANQATFLPFDGHNILTVFIAWLNLDLGIETCFYNGMNAYAKIWLQFVFPTYIIFLICVIIVICEFSERFANLIGSKNPVATLSTLFLLSYTKFLRLTIAALNFTYLDHLNDDSKELVWHYDANVAYLKGKHIPLFVTAILIIIIGVIYTFFLLFWQWLRHCSNRRVLRWMNNTKLKALIDVYHAPYQPRHRYWTGLLLLARVFLYLVSAFNYSGEPRVILISVGCVLAVLLLLKMVCTQRKIYKNWGSETLDTLCLLNLLIYVIFSFYLCGINVDPNKIRQWQVSLAYTSVSVSLAIFLSILVYHTYTAFLIKTKFCKTILRLLHIPRNYNQEEENRLLPDTSRDESSDEEDDINLCKNLRDILTGPTSEDDFHQLEADACSDRTIERRRARANKQEVTHTVVEIPRPELPLTQQIGHSRTLS